MTKSKVYFIPVNEENSSKMPEIARDLLEKLITDNKIVLEKEIPIKLHPGEPGNISFVKAENYGKIIDFFHSKKINTYFIETNTVTGQRTNKSDHLISAKKHGFTKVPFIIADGAEGENYIEVKIRKGKHFKTAKIAAELANKNQILVSSHFKGHGLTGFGGALKNLSLGFASRRGKMELHSKNYHSRQTTIKWWQVFKLYLGKTFRERMAEYASAAVNNKHYLYLTFAIDIVSDCDCDGRKMKPIYKDLGVFASNDPVAVDKACFDMLTKREGRKPFSGDDVFSYAEKIGLGSQTYDLS